MKPFVSLAFVGLTLAASPAGAADLGSAPLSIPASQGATAVEIGSNWYLRGDIGVSFDALPSVSLSSFSALPPGLVGSPPSVFGRTSSSGAGFTGGLGFGYRYNDFVRFDATWDYGVGPSRTRSAFVVCPYGLAGVNGATTGLPAGYLYNTAETCDGFLNFHQHNNTFLANAYVDLGTYAGFTPYVGGGVGMNVNGTQGSVNFYETANGQPYAANLASNGAFPQIWVDPTGQRLNPQPTIAFAQQNWNRAFSSTAYRVAWALSVGFGFRLNPSATLDVGYRYLNGGASSMLVNPQTGLSVRQSNSSQQLRVGIRYVLQ